MSYRPLPAGAHGLPPSAVAQDQRERLRRAMVELIAEVGYPAVRIADLVRLSRVSRPTLYELFADKEELLASAYREIAAHAARVVVEANSRDAPPSERVRESLAALAAWAAAEPDAVSLIFLGAFGAGPRALAQRGRVLERIEAQVAALRGSEDRTHGASSGGPEDARARDDLTVKLIVGGVREVAARRLRGGREQELEGLVDELAAWVSSYPPSAPAALLAPRRLNRAGTSPRRAARGAAAASTRARGGGGRLPSGRSDMPRRVIRDSQRERIVDATAAIVAERGLDSLTVPEIARRANVSLETFYAIYRSKREALLGAQKVGLHQAVRVAAEAFDADMPDWPRAIAAGLRAIVDYLVAEPAHAHLSIVDTVGASPEASATRERALGAFASYFDPGYRGDSGATAPSGAPGGALAQEAVVGGAWQVLHYYVETGRVAELPAATPQLIYLVLTPFLGAAAAARAAHSGAAPVPA
ncbi:MAG TPA: TetR/AcrR family transcriptional regulator [Solirubrobacteraceae bacterium]|nr:TetR/AcrR family transcriptional regulator [Solirubrobacteraceae bacterium]